MFNMSLDEFLEEVKAEMYGYEELTEEDINEWEVNFKNYIGKNKNDKKLVVKGDTITVKLKDESDLFSIVDRYLAAVDKEEKELYWTDWTL